MKYLLAATSFIFVLAAHPVVAQNVPNQIQTPFNTCLNKAFFQKQADTKRKIPKKQVEKIHAEAIKACIDKYVRW